MKINTYCISNEGSIINYGHFMFAVLIPLLYQDLVALSSGTPPNTYVMKINIGPLFHILSNLFGDRVKQDYIVAPNILSDKQNYYELYLKLLVKPPKHSILLDAFDIFNDTFYSLITPNKFDSTEFEHLTHQFTTKKLSKKNKEKYKQLFITDKFFKLKAARPIILSFFNEISPILSHPIVPIIVIERRQPTLDEITKDLTLNAGGARRVIANHTEMVDALIHEFGVNAVQNLRMENYTMGEQFRIFSEARVIVAQHGAALSNIIFCGPHTTIVEITPELGENKWHLNLAEFCNVGYIKIPQPELTKVGWRKMFGAETEIPNMFDKDKLYSAKMQYDPLAAFIRNSGYINVMEVVRAVKSCI